jgi:cytochrome P450
VGERSVSMTPDPAEHAALRGVMQPFFTPDAVAARGPAIQRTVRLAPREPWERPGRRGAP